MSPTRGKPAVSLTAARSGQWALVLTVDGGHGAGHRLAHLGMISGHRVRMIRPSRTGPVVVEVKGSRLALGQGLARTIHVRLIDAAPNVGPEPVAVPAE